MDAGADRQRGQAWANVAAALSFLGAGWLVLDFLVGLVFDLTLHWGSEELSGPGLFLILTALLVILLAGGVLSLNKHRMGLVVLAAVGLVGTIVSGIGLRLGGSAGPMPAIYWWLLLLIATIAFALDLRPRPQS